MVSDALRTFRNVRANRESEHFTLLTEPYSEREQLNLLLDAIQNATENRNEVEVATLGTLADVTTMEYLPIERDIASDDSAAEPVHQKSHIIDRAKRDIQHQVAARSKEVINTLRSRINGD